MTTEPRKKPTYAEIEHAIQCCGTVGADMIRRLAGIVDAADGVRKVAIVHLDAGNYRDARDWLNKAIQ